MNNRKAAYHSSENSDQRTPFSSNLSAGTPETILSSPLTSSSLMLNSGKGVGEDGKLFNDFLGLDPLGSTPRPRGCRYMRGGGAANSADPSGAGTGSRVSGGPGRAVNNLDRHHNNPKPLAVPDRPTITIFTDGEFFDVEDGADDLMSPPANRTGDGRHYDDSRSPMLQSPGIKMGRDSTDMETPVLLSTAATSAFVPSMPALVSTSLGDVGGAGTGDQFWGAGSYPAQIAPIVPYGDEASRRKIAEDVERRAALEEEKAKIKAKEKKPPGSSPGKSTENLSRVQIVRMGIQRLKERLKDLKLVIRRIKNDGNCQFRAISQQLLGSEECHDIVRHHVVSYMKRVRKEQFDCYFDSPDAADRYFQRLSQLGTWGDELTLRGASDSLYINIYVISSEERNFVIVYRPRPDAPPAPAFLVDVAKTREAIRESMLQSQYNSANCSQSCSFVGIGSGGIAGQTGMLQKPPTGKNKNPAPLLQPGDGPRLLTPLSASCPVFQDPNASVPPPTSAQPAMPMTRRRGNILFRPSTNPSTAPSRRSSLSAGMEGGKPPGEMTLPSVGSSVVGGNPLGVEEGEECDHTEIDAYLLQTRLQAQLSKSTIHSAQPGFMRMGESVIALEHHPQLFSNNNSIVARSMNLNDSFTPGRATRNTSYVLPPSQNAVQRQAQSLDVSLLQSNTPSGKKKKSGGLFGSSSSEKKNKEKTSGKPPGMQRFIAAGAEVDSDPWNHSIRIIRPEDDVAVDVPAPAPHRLLHPVAPLSAGQSSPGTAPPSGPSFSSSPGGASGLRRAAEARARSKAAVVNNAASRNSMNASSMDAGGAATSSSFPVFPHMEGVNVTLVASRGVSEEGTVSRSLPYCAESAPAVGGASGLVGDAAEDVNNKPSDTLLMPQFHFEAHSKPIDVFLSYLFPVHYNALAPDDGHFPNDPSKWFSAAPAEPTTPQKGTQDSGLGISPKFVSVPFLKPSTAPTSVNASFAMSMPTVSGIPSNNPSGAPLLNASTYTESAARQMWESSDRLTLLKPQGASGSHKPFEREQNRLGKPPVMSSSLET